MSLSLESAVTNKPRTLPACFSTQTLNRRKIANVSSETTESSRLKDENDSIPKCFPTSNLVTVNTLENASTSAQDENSTHLVNSEKVTDIPMEEWDTDVESPSEPPVNDSVSVRNEREPNTPTFPSSSPHSNVPIVDNPSPTVSSSDCASTITISTSDNVSSVTSPSSNAQSKKRPVCQYGASCYRRNPQHKIEFSHPQDEDYEEEQCRPTSSTDASANKPPCWYGTRCYRKNKEHLEQFSHSFSSSGRPKRSTTINVEIRCDSDDSEELEDFHTDSDEYEASFIDDDGSSDDELVSEDDVASQSSNDATTSEDEADKKRKKKTSGKKKKKKT